LRAKGVLCLADPPRQRILQVVRQLYEITDAAAQLLPDEPGVSRLVLIGRHLNAARLADSLRDVGAFRVDSTS
jgi:G3E family GTPase